MTIKSFKIHCKPSIVSFWGTTHGTGTAPNHGPSSRHDGNPSQQIKGGILSQLEKNNVLTRITLKKYSWFRNLLIF